MRVLAPKVHVEVFRPTQLTEPTRGESGELTSVRINPGVEPTQLTYIKHVEIEDRRIKGIQFEETALFGGFIEINIAEDPQSDLFDKFLPNDHVEVFYSDGVKRAGDDEKVYLHNLTIQSDYDYASEAPKFQGASWKTDLKYRPTMVTTQLHAWDYLRILQYINIPKGERKEKFLSSSVDFADESKTRLKISKQRQKYGDDMLDYIDGAVTAFVSNFDENSIYGQHQIPPETAGAVPTSGLKFTKTSLQSGSTQPILSFYKAGVGEYLHEKIQDQTNIFGHFQDIYANRDDKVWNAPPYAETPDGLNAEIYTADAAIKDVSDAIDDMEEYDIYQFRIIDGEFRKFIGKDKDPDGNDKLGFEDPKHVIVDIIAISQFALIELLVKKLTTDHGLNRWFTPIIRFDSNFIDEVVGIADKIKGRGISKLVYVRLRQKPKDGLETTTFSFNLDTYPFAMEYTTEAYKLAIGNLVNSFDSGAVTTSTVDVFAEILATLDFPQRPLEFNEDHYTIQSLTERMISDPMNQSNIKNHFQAFQDLSTRFQQNFIVDSEFAGQSNPRFYNTLMRRVTSFASLIQKSLTKDDKMISFIRGVPASFMRADIYTGSKFNTVSYDSLAITRMIQLIASNMAGFPATNNPKSNTEKGKIDSYPIFAANRIVIHPQVYFGRKIPQGSVSGVHYQLFRSLSELYSIHGHKDQVEATCFLFLDVAKKKLKDAGIDKETGEEYAPDFVFPMEDIQDFGMIKAATVNHHFVFSIADHWKDFSLFKKAKETEAKPEYLYTIENGIFIDYQEGGLSPVGYSPPEHQHLKLEDLTQNKEYTSWAGRYNPSINITSDDENMPVFQPRTAYTNRQDDPEKKLYGGVKRENNVIINNYDTFGKQEAHIKANLVWLTDSNGIATNVIADEEFETDPFHGITGFVDISDIKSEYKTLQIILESENTSYRDISNVDLKLMETIKIRAPIKFEYNKRATKYDDRIKLKTARSEGRADAKAFTEASLSDVIKETNKELDKIEETDMMWLFPYSGYRFSDATGEPIALRLDAASNTYKTWSKHLFLITYLDLLIKGIRYILWSMAKARFFAHVYLPIEYKKYAKKSPGNLNYESSIVEPGSSVQIRYNEDNTLFKTVEDSLVAFPIKGLKKGDENAHLPLYRTVSRGTVGGSATEIGRNMTWYVSKKVTYIGADVGAMMRVEMTEGSLDWTLFYNEKNLLTQVSEHYLLNGLGNFRTGGTF